MRQVSLHLGRSLRLTLLDLMGAAIVHSTRMQPDPGITLFPLCRSFVTSLQLFVRNVGKKVEGCVRARGAHGFAAL